MDQRCRSGQACVAITADGPAVTYKPLCQRCVEDIQAKLDVLPKILDGSLQGAVGRIPPLAEWKGGMSGENGEAKVSAGKSDPPCPLRVNVVDLIDDINSVLHRVNGLRVNDLVMQSDGAIWAQEIRRVFRAADKTIGISQQKSPRLTPCPDCGQRSLMGYAGEDLVRCDSCGTCLTLDEYVKATLRMVAIQKKERK